MPIETQYSRKLLAVVSAYVIGLMAVVMGLAVWRFGGPVYGEVAGIGTLIVASALVGMWVIRLTPEDLGHEVSDALQVT